MQNHEQYEEVIKLFVQWNEKMISDNQFAIKVVKLIGTDYNSASSEIEEEQEAIDLNTPPEP